MRRKLASTLERASPNVRVSDCCCTFQVADFGISRVKDPTKSYLSATNNNGTPGMGAHSHFGAQ